MKNLFQQLTIRRSTQLLIAVFVTTAAIGISNVNATGYPDTNSNGSINTGDASPYTVLTHGDLNMSGTSSITGDVGVDGSGNANLSGSSHINGNLTINNKGKYTHSGTSGVTGTVTRDQTALDNAWADATSLSTTAGMESPTSNYSVNGTPVTTATELKNVNLNNGTQMTIAGGASQKIVLSLQNFMLDKSSTFTLQGTTTTTFIINVTKSFSLDHASQIALVGVPPANVLFNLKGDLSGTINHGSQASGIILALKGTVSVVSNSGGKTPVGSHLTGEIIAKQVQLNDSASVSPITPVMNH